MTRNWSSYVTYSNGEPSGMVVKHNNLNIRLDFEESPLSDVSYEAIIHLVRLANEGTTQ